MRSFPARATFFFGGVLLCSYCYLLVAQSSFGSSPLFVFEEGISTVTGVPFGVVTIATGGFFVTIALILRAPVGPGTFAVPALFGLGVSVLQPLAPVLSGTAVRLAVFLVATHVMMLGAAMVVCASYGAAAIDAVMMGLARLSRRSAARVRIAMEVTLALSGFALGGRAGLGTAVAAMTVGHSFAFWARILPSPTPSPSIPLEQRPVRRTRDRRRVRPSLSMQQRRLALSAARPSRSDPTENRSTDALAKPDERHSTDDRLVVPDDDPGEFVQRQRGRQRRGHNRGLRGDRVRVDRRGRSGGRRRGHRNAGERGRVEFT